MYAIVDIETTGGYASAGSITEIAVLLHDGTQRWLIERLGAFAFAGLWERATGAEPFDLAPRLAQGSATLYKHAIEGYTGSKGMMPARGGGASLSDDEVKAVSDYFAGLAPQGGAR